jgi:hypothetical protein
MLDSSHEPHPAEVPVSTSSADASARPRLSAALNYSRPRTPDRSCSASTTPLPPRSTPSASSKPLVAIARSILVIVWHLLADPTARYHDLGSGYHASRTDKDKKARSHIRQLQALGYTVTLTQAA